MFVQVVRSKITDTAAARGRLEAWRDDVRPGAIGFVGSMTGVDDDGSAVTVARFTSAADAAANSARPEQAAWWDTVSPLISGEPAFVEGEDVDTELGGPSADAGFVQVMIGQCTDRPALQALEAEALPLLQAAHPGLLGSVRLWDGDTFHRCVYMTSEAAATAGATAAAKDEALAMLLGRMNLLTPEAEVLTFRDPIVIEG